MGCLTLVFPLPTKAYLPVGSYLSCAIPSSHLILSWLDYSRQPAGGRICILSFVNGGKDCIDATVAYQRSNCNNRLPSSDIIPSFGVINGRAGTARSLICCVCQLKVQTDGQCKPHAGGYSTTLGMDWATGMCLIHYFPVLAGLLFCQACPAASAIYQITNQKKNSHLIKWMLDAGLSRVCVYTTQQVRWPTHPPAHSVCHGRTYARVLNFVRRRGLSSSRPMKPSHLSQSPVIQTERTCEDARVYSHKRIAKAAKPPANPRAASIEPPSLSDVCSCSFHLDQVRVVSMYVWMLCTLLIHD